MVRDIAYVSMWKRHMSSSSGFQPPLKEPARNTAKLFCISSLMLVSEKLPIYMTCDKHSCDVWILCALNSAWDVSPSAATCLRTTTATSSELLRSGSIGETAALLSVRTSFIFGEVWHCSLRLFLQLVVRGRGCSELVSCRTQPAQMDCGAGNVPGALFAEIAGLEAVRWNLASGERPSLGWNTCEW